MATIYTRTGKGSALTWTEGDANITNLNAAKIENVVEDTTPQLGGNLDVNGNSIVSTSNGNINLTPNGSGNINLTPTTGHVTISATNFPTGTGTNGQVLSTDGAGNASWATVSGGGGLANIVEDTTPQLGGNLDLNDKSITNSGTLDTYIDAGTDNNLYLRTLGNGNVVLAAIGTGQVQITHPLKIGDLVFPSGLGTNGQVLTTNGTNAITWTTPSSTATVASTVTLTADNTTNAANYPLFVNAATGNLSPRTDNGFTYNPATGTLTFLIWDAPPSTVISLAGSATNQGQINGMRIGNTTPGTGQFTGLTARGVANSPKLTLDTTAVSSTAWTTTGIGLRVSAATYSDTSSLAGTVAASHVNAIATPTIASTNIITVTDAGTLYIADGPTAGTNTTITNKWALLTPGNIKAANITLTGSLTGAHNGTVGATTPAAATFTTMTANTAVLDDIRETIFALTYAATITPDAANGSVQTITLTGPVTFSAFANPVSGQTITLIITQDATGSRLLTSTMKFAGASKTLSTAANSIDILTVSYIGTTYYASLSKGFA